MEENNAMGEVQVEETEIEIPEETIKGIAAEVAKSLKAEKDEEIESLKKQLDELRKSEPTVEKDVRGSFGTTRATDAFESARKEVRFMKHFRAVAKGNKSEAARMNEFNAEKMDEITDDYLASKGVTGRYLNKATYNNYTTDSEGGYLIPDPEFLIGIERYEAQYGVAFANATVRTTDRQVVKANTGATNVDLYETAEGAQKTQTKPTFDQETATMRKFAGIAVATDEFIEDEAAGFWQDVQQGFARARAKQADILVFTEDTPTNKGILNTSGVITETVGSAITSITWDDLLNAEAGVLPDGRNNAKFVFHRTVWNTLRKSKGTTNDHYFWLPTMGNATPWGTQVIESELFRTAAAGENNQPYGLYGDLSKLQLWVNGGLALKVLTEGTVGSINLAEQDMTGLRAVTRMTSLVTFPERFVVIGTGSVS